MGRQRVKQWPDAAVAGLIVGCCALLGVPLGWLWQQLAPRTLAFVTPDGYLIPEESESQVAADGRALLIATGTGLAIGAGLWLWRSRRGPLLLAAAVAGAAAAALIMDLSALLLTGGPADGEPGEVLTLPVQVRAQAVLLAAPLAALLAHSLGPLFIARDDLGRPERGGSLAGPRAEPLAGPLDGPVPVHGALDGPLYGPPPPDPAPGRQPGRSDQPGALPG